MSLTLKGYDFDCQTALNGRKLATSASTFANQSLSRVTITNPGGDNFQECRISLCGLVRAFLADSCVSFQIVNTRETACDRLHLSVHAVSQKNIVGSGTRSANYLSCTASARSFRLTVNTLSFYT